MTNIECIAAEYDRRKRILEDAGYHVQEFGMEGVLIVEMFVDDERRGDILIRKQEGIALAGRTPFVFECRKLMALQRLANAVPRMWAARKLRETSEHWRE